jgi:hypothetical protein
MKTLPRFVALIVAASLLAAAAIAADAPKAATPEAAFENFKASAAKKDYKSLFNTITPDSQDVLVGGMALNLQVMAMMDPAKYADGKKLLQKHGVKELDPTQMQFSATRLLPLMKETAAGVKDKPACFTEIQEWAEKNVPDAKANAGKIADIASSKLSDVKTSGDTATANLKVTQDGKESPPQPIIFKKMGEAWYVDFAALVPAGGPGMDPGPKGP